MEKGKEKGESEAGNGAATSPSSQEPSAKKARLDLPIVPTLALPETPGPAGSEPKPMPFESPREEVLDDRLCLLSHEQLELLVTRLARSDKQLEDKILRQIERLEHSMSMYSPRRTEFSPRPFMMTAGSPLVAGSPRSPFPMMGMMGMGMGMGMRGGGDFGFDDLGGEEINVKAIRRKVRGAFQKLKDGSKRKRRRGEEEEPQKYRLDSSVLRKEIKKGKDLVLIRNDIEHGLEVLEAITDEYISTGSELGEENVDQYDDCLQEIAQDWVDLFLSDAAAKLTSEDRSDWVNKLFVWDKSADEAEGTFSSARAAAKLGWQDTHLQQVLAGDHIGKYKEPEALSIVRCNILERDRKLEQALNLAKAVELHHFTARFLIKLGRSEEALATAKAIEDPAKVYSLAQVARSMDVKVAFALTLQSIAQTFEWNQPNNERALWLCDLAISQGMVNQLVEDTEKTIKHKSIQFEIAKILKDKTAFKPALGLAAIVLKQWPPAPLPDPKVPLTQQQLLQIQREEMARQIPAGVPKWMWDVAYEMIVIETGTREDLEQVLETILQDVTQVEQLLALGREMNMHQEYEQIIRLCKRCMEIATADKAKDLEEQKNILTEYFWAVLRKVQPPPIPPMRPMGYNTNFDRNVTLAATMLLNAALDSKIPPELQPPTTVLKIVRPFKAIEQSVIAAEVASCINYIVDPTHLAQYAAHLRNRKEYALVHEVGARVQVKLDELAKQRVETDAWKAELATLQAEQAELLSKRKPLASEKQDRLNELCLINELQILVPPYEKYSASQLDNLQVGIAKLMLGTVVDNAIAEALQLRSIDEQILEVGLSMIVANRYVVNPSYRIQMLNDLRNRIGQHFGVTVAIRQIAPLVLDYIEQLRTDYIERQNVLVPLSILQAELQEATEQFLLKKRKDATLPPEKQERFEKLTAIAATYAPLPYPATSTADFDTLNQQVVSMLVSTATDTRQQIDESRWLSDKDIDEVIAIAVKYTQDPGHLRSLMDQIRRSTSGRVGDFTYEFTHGYELVVQLGQTALARVKELDDARVERFEPYFEKKELDREANELELQKKTLTPEQQARVEKLDEEYKIQRATNSKYVFSNANVNEKLRLGVFQTMLGTAYDNKNRFESRIAVDPESYSAEMIADGRALRRMQIDSVVDIIDKNARDPSHLLSIGNTLSDNMDYMHVVRYVKRVLAIVEQLEADRKERSEWEAELADLESEIADLASKRKTPEPELIEKITPLRKLNARKDIMASFEKQTWSEHDDYILSAAQLALSALFRVQNSIDMQLNSEAEDVPVLQLTQQRKEVAELVGWVIDEVIGKRIENPSHILSLGQTLLNHSEYARVMPMALFACNRTLEIRKTREEREDVLQWIQLLTSEQQELAVAKKDLAPAQQKQLDKAEKTRDEFPEMPHYARMSFDTMEENIFTAARLVLRSAVGSLHNIKAQIAAQQPDSPPILQDELKAAQKAVTDALEFAVNRVGNPQRLLALADEMAQREEYELQLPLAMRCLTRQAELNKEYEDRLEQERELQRLRAQEAEAVRNRKTLDDKTKQRKRELEHQQMLRQQILASFYRTDPISADATCSGACSKRVDTSLQIKADTESKMAMDESLDEAEVERRKEKLAARVREVIEESIPYVHNPRNLFALAQRLKNRLEYANVIIVGTRCQARIEELVKENETRLDLQTKLGELRQQLVVAPSDEVRDEIEKLGRELEQLPVQYESTGALNNLNLQMASMMIEAAKVEERKDVLRDQAVLRFKISPTIPLFEEVKILTEPDEWPDVKKELLEQILKPVQDDQSSGFGAQPTIDPRAKMELLLNEGMWKQALPLFPDPPYGSMEMLERLMLDLERNSPEAFDDILPLVEKYAVYYYGSFNFNQNGLDRVLDQAQRRNPDFVFGLFQRAIEKMLLNVLPKQYQDIVTFLQMFKKRLVDDLGREDDWEAFLADVTKQHKGKRKLMQLINQSKLKE